MHQKKKIFFVLFFFPLTNRFTASFRHFSLLEFTRVSTISIRGVWHWSRDPCVSLPNSNIPPNPGCFNGLSLPHPSKVHIYSAIFL